jgi:hypothetical protein
VRYTKPCVYVVFDGKFYRLSPEEWEGACKRGAQGEAIDYRTFSRPLNAPWWVRAANGGWTGIHRDHIVVSPQTWLPIDYLEATHAG